jgi:putative DNA primase/helicase
MSPIDCNLDFETPRGEYDDWTPPVELGKFLGSDAAQDLTETKRSSGLHGGSSSSLTQEFCHPDRTTPLSPDEGAALWQALRRNEYVPCAIKPGSKRPSGNGWQKQAFEETTAWSVRAPGIGLVCGDLNQNGNPAPAAGSLLVVDCDFRLTKAVAEYEGRASKASSEGKVDQATRLYKIAGRLREMAPTLAEKEQTLSRLLSELTSFAKLRASTLERGRANSPNFALLFRNDGTLGNDTPKLYLSLDVEGKTELIEAFGVDRLAAGKQLVGYHLHPETGRPWLWESNQSPENTPLSALPQISAQLWEAWWRQIANVGATIGLVEGGRGATKPLENGVAIADSEWESSLLPGNADRPPPAETMCAMLEHLTGKNYFEDREDVLKDDSGRIVKIGWRETGMALKLAYGDKVGFELWAITHLDERARNDAPGQWASFAAEPRPGHVTISTIIKAAKDAKFVRALSRVVAAEPGYVSCSPFTMDAHQGLTKEIITSRGRNATVEMVWICAPFEVLGACRDPHGRGWGKQIRFLDSDNRLHMRHVSEATLQGEPASLCATLADEGLKINRSRQKELAEYLISVGVDKRVTIVNHTGWHEVDGRPVFVLPAETIAAGISEIVVLDQMANGPYEARRTLEDWKRGVGALTAGHALPMFMVSAALAGPLAHLVGAEGGGVHLFGPSSIGKSAMLEAAASVWGRGGARGYVRSWRATANGLEGAAASATDTCLVLDELGVGEARDVAAAIYALANGVGKGRAARDGSLREPRCWRVFVLSSGELPVETKLGEERGRKIRAGQLVRLLDIPADRGFGFGAFDHAGDYEDSGKLADAIKYAGTAAYGTAGPEFVRHLVAADAEQIAIAKEFMVTFVRSVVEQGASEQIIRAAKKFALIALAGELATVLGVTPWQTGEARKAAILAFNRWVEKRGGTGSHEERQAIAQVRLMIEQHGEARFQRVDHSPAEVRDRLGWRKGEKGDREWYVPPEVWKAEFCNGLDPTFVARTLAGRGMLRRQDEKHIQCVVALGEKQRIRAYVLTTAILDCGEGEG